MTRKYHLFSGLRYSEGEITKKQSYCGRQPILITSFLTTVDCKTCLHIALTKLFARISEVENKDR